MTREQVEEQLTIFAGIVRAETLRLVDLHVDPSAALQLAINIANARLLAQVTRDREGRRRILPPFERPGPPQ